MAVWFIQNRDYTGSWQKRYITIRRIEPEAVADGKLVVPREIDGFKVLGIGAWNILTDRVPYEALTSYSGDSLESVVNHYRVLDEIERIEELVLPEGLDFIGSYALEGSRSLLEITFPPDIYVSCFAFGSLPIKTDSVFRPKKIILYSDSVVDIKDYTAIEFLKESKAEIYIRYHNQGQFYYTLSGYVEKIYVDKKIGFFALSSVMGEEDYVDAPPPSYNVKRLIINGKGTSLQFPYYANEPSVNDLSVLDKDGSWISGVKGLYTVRGAASIAEARVYKTSYYWKEAGKSKEVKAVKKSGVYRARWKKIKTSIYKHEYKVKKEKWKVTKSPIQTVYKVYGKKKKGGSYQYIKTTKKRSIQSKYKYIKAAPVKEWE